MCLYGAKLFSGSETYRLVRALRRWFVSGAAWHLPVFLDTDVDVMNQPILDAIDWRYHAMGTAEESASRIRDASASR